MLLLSFLQRSPPSSPHRMLNYNRLQWDSHLTAQNCSAERCRGFLLPLSSPWMTREYFLSCLLLLSLQSHTQVCSCLAPLAGRHSLETSRQFPVHNPLPWDCLHSCVIQHTKCDIPNTGQFFYAKPGDHKDSAAAGKEFPQQISSPAWAPASQQAHAQRCHITKCTWPHSVLLSEEAEFHIILLRLVDVSRSDFWLTFSSLQITCSAYLCTAAQKIGLICFRYPTSQLVLIASPRRKVHKFTLLCKKANLPFRMNISFIFVWSLSRQARWWAFSGPETSLLR